MTSRRIISLSVIAVFMLSIMILAYPPSRGKIGYCLWVRGMVPLQPEYLSAFTRDYDFRQKFVGQPIEALRPFFPKLHSGTTYDPSSYRANGVQQWFTKDNGTKFEDFWLEGTQQDFGYCVLVVDDKIRDFFFVKG